MLSPIHPSRFESALATPSGWIDLALTGLCIGIAWAWERRHARRVRPPEAGPQTHLQAGVGLIAFSLIALVLLVLARYAFARRFGAPLFIDIAIPALVALAAIRVLVYGMRRLFAAQAWLRTSERAISFTIWGLAALYFVGVLPELARELDELVIPVGRSTVSLLTIFKGVAAVVATLIVALWLSGLLERRLLAATTLDSNTRAVLANVVRALLLLVGTLFALQAIGFDLTLLTVFGGALGVGIGLGLQKLAANYIAGYTILLERAIRLGDLVTVDGRQGHVARVTARYVIVRSFDGVEAIVPNETLVTTTVLNHTRATHDIRIAVPVQVAADTDVELALRLMAEAGRAEARVAPAADPPTALVTTFADGAIGLEAVLWIAGPQAGVAEVRSALYRRILDAFKAHGVRLHEPRRDGRGRA